MGKKKSGGNLGRALIKDRFSSRRNGRKDGESYFHTTELNDGYDWGRLNLQSVTEESSFQEFLSTAQLAGTEFQAEKLNIKFVSPNETGLLPESKKKAMLAQQEKNKGLLKIPRRPAWDRTMSAEALQSAERKSFLEWRRQLALLQEVENLLMTPYEKNLEFWRQLWRVIERSDVIVQIVDARNPLLFRCEDLETYVREVDPNKINLILLNKADFLTQEQRQIWADYFTKLGLKVAFFSATQAVESMKTIEEVSSESEERFTDEEDDSADERSSISSYHSCTDDEDGAEVTDEDDKVGDQDHCTDEADVVPSEMEKLSQLRISDNPVESADRSEMALQGGEASNSGSSSPSVPVENSPELLGRDELIDLFQKIYKGKTYMNGVTTIGLVGYPNVGKSSTINALMMGKKVSVSATPGKTKHFQTLYLSNDLMLCDCPGLVMPSFISTKSEMILNGILPIDQMKDHVPPMNLLGTLIPRHVIEDTYGIMLPEPGDGEDPDRPPYSEEILNSYGYNRGFMTHNGQPDNPRSSRYLLKDFVNGRLLYCVAPPGIPQETYHKFPPRCRATRRHVPPATLRATRGSSVNDGAEVDRSFLNQGPGYHIKGKIGIAAVSHGTGDKPWKKYNKHANKNKREKLRRVHAHLDLH